MRLAFWRKDKPPKKYVIRNYDGARTTRLNSEFGIGTTSADWELGTSLQGLRNRCRALVRNNPYAKRARTIVQNNIIGGGVGLQSSVAFANGKLRDKINSEIEKAFGEWSKASSCHIAGILNFADIESLLIGEMFETGEILVRLHKIPVGNSAVPLSLEIVEPERLADDTDIPNTLPGNVVRLGIEQDKFGRPQAYWLRSIHPGDRRSDWSSIDKLERVPASEIIHLYIVNRWPQTRGEPWMHAAIRKLQDIGGYTESELVAARAAASYMGFIKAPDEAELGDEQEDGTVEMEMVPGMIRRLPPGHEFNGWAPNRPNAQAEPFIRLMLREVSASIPGVSYEGLSKDYSQSNYSSSRLSLIDDREIWRSLQRWYIRAFRARLHEVWLEAAVTFGALPIEHLEMFRKDRQNYISASFKPRGWSWVDPTKEVSAYKEAERAGYITKADVIAATAGGADIEDTMKARKRELDLIESLGLEFDTDSPKESASAPQDQQQDQPHNEEDMTNGKPQRAATIRAIS